MNKTQLAVLGAVAFSGFALGVTNSAVFAQEATPPSTQAASKPPMAQMHEAIENKDFAAFEVAIKNHPINIIEQKITADNFDKFAQMHELMRAGKKDEADKIREELGLPEMPRHGEGMRGKHPFGKRFHHRMMDEAPTATSSAS